MKKIYLTLLFAGVAHVAMAQNTASKADVLKVIQMNGADAQMKMAKNQILKMIPGAKKDQFLKDFDAALPGLYDNLTKVYMESYTKEDIKAMMDFYETPVGKKIAAKSLDLSEKCIVATLEWSQGLQDLMMKYMQ